MPPFYKTRWFKGSLITAIFGGLIVIGLICDVRWAFRDRIYAADKAPHEPVIMILGASLKPDGQPSDALADRLKVGVELYQQNKAQTILLTGDDGRFHSNEIQAMREYLRQAGVPEPVVLFDGQGYRTYESCARAKRIYGITRAIIVTQNFHLPRALYLCNKLGVNAVGISADLRPYEHQQWNVLRDWLASAKAWWDVNVWTPKPPV